MSQKNAYEFQQEKSVSELTFFFISEGSKEIIKVVQYSFIRILDGTPVYNLGFGDYDIENEMMHDNVNTNNGDAYKVFNTVLNTIPVFFTYHPGAMLMVQGSDGRPEFTVTCRLTCVKKCQKDCKNYNRRLNVYKGYVNKNFIQLSVDYQFFGGKWFAFQGIVMEPYLIKNDYEAVFVLKKKV